MDAEIIRQLKILNMSPEYWKIESFDKDNIVLNPGSEHTIIDKIERGKLLGIFISVTYPRTEFMLKVDEIITKDTPEAAYQSGRLGFNPTTMWVGRYDDKNSIYTLWVTPSPPMAYFGRLYGAVRVPEDAPAPVLLSYRVDRYRFIGEVK